MNEIVPERSAFALLAIYTVSVVACMLVATLVLIADIFPPYGDIVFIVMFGVALIPTWPLAILLEERVAARMVRSNG